MNRTEYMLPTSTRCQYSSAKILDRMSCSEANYHQRSRMILWSTVTYSTIASGRVCNELEVMRDTAERESPVQPEERNVRVIFTCPRAFQSARCLAKPSRSLRWSSCPLLSSFSLSFSLLSDGFYYTRFSLVGNKTSVSSEFRLRLIFSKCFPVRHIKAQRRNFDAR
jgi:hypothetical protein